MDVEHRVWRETATPPVFGKEITPQVRIAFSMARACLALFRLGAGGISFPYKDAVFSFWGDGSTQWIQRGNQLKAFDYRTPMPFRDCQRLTDNNGRSGAGDAHRCRSLKGEIP
jgi:hypothetical protein